MKLNKFLICGAMGAMLLPLASCDDINENERFTPVDKPVKAESPRMLLVQEFTGIGCTNCPKGAAALHNLAENYEGQVILVGMQPEGGGPNTEGHFDIINGKPTVTDFRCDEAQVMFLYYQPKGFPTAIFNGKDANSDYNTWTTTAANYLGLNADLSIKASCTYDEASREASVDYTLDFINNVNDELSVMVWITESNIIGYQLNDGVGLTDYVHNHVLRASLNGDWGETLGNTFAEGDSKTGSASMELNSKWVAENCNIVVYVFRNSDKEVLQAVEIDVVAPAENEE